MYILIINSSTPKTIATTVEIDNIKDENIIFNLVLHKLNITKNQEGFQDTMDPKTFPVGGLGRNGQNNRFGSSYSKNLQAFTQSN